MFLGFDELFGKKLEKVDHFMKSLKNHRFSQNLQLFEQTIIFGGCNELFEKNLQKVANFVKKPEKSSIW